MKEYANRKMNKQLTELHRFTQPLHCVCVKKIHDIMQKEGRGKPPKKVFNFKLKLGPRNHVSRSQPTSSNDTALRRAEKKQTEMIHVPTTIYPQVRALHWDIHPMKVDCQDCIAKRCKAHLVHRLTKNLVYQFRNIHWNLVTLSLAYLRS